MRLKRLVFRTLLAFGAAACATAWSQTGVIQDDPPRPHPAKPAAKGAAKAGAASARNATPAGKNAKPPAKSAKPAARKAKPLAQGAKQAAKPAAKRAPRPRPAPKKPAAKPRPAQPKPAPAAKAPARHPPEAQAPVPAPEAAPKAEAPPRDSPVTKILPSPRLSTGEAEGRYQVALELESRGEGRAAMQAYTEAAEGGHALAQKKLGDLYGTGSDFVERDYETSLRWYQRAREQGVSIPKPFTYPGVRR